MRIKELSIIKSDERGIIYDCDVVKLIVRHKGSIGADHFHEQEEILYLIEGEIEMTVGEEVKNIKAPVKIEITAGLYHKVVALSEIKLLEIRV